LDVTFEEIVDKYPQHRQMVASDRRHDKTSVYAYPMGNAKIDTQW